MSRNPFEFAGADTTRMLEWAARKIADGPDPRHGARSFFELEAELGGSITDTGIGADEAIRRFTEVIVPATRPFGHPTSLSFVASAPSAASLSLDAALGSAAIFAGNWDGGAGAIHAENQALAWLARLAGWPNDAGGVFVAGGTLGNLSALHAARSWCRERRAEVPDRWAILTSREAHSSIEAVARVMDVELIQAPTDRRGVMDAAIARQHLDNPHRVFAIVANAGATNCGAVDDIAGLADLCDEHGIWLHVDGAYGLAAMAEPEARRQFDGIERAMSFIVDPHKWLFAPYDSCALVYRRPEFAAKAHGQSAAYLDAVDKSHWNPSDYALHLTRRARGLPLWFSLATHGATAYAEAIAKTLSTAREIAERIDAARGLELVLGPQLTVILFRVPGLSVEGMSLWAETNRRSGAILCLPTTWRGDKVFRLCVVNPATDADEVMQRLESAVPN